MARSDRRRTRARRPSSEGNRARETHPAAEAAANGTGGGPNPPVSQGPPLRPTGQKRRFNPFGWMRRFEPKAVADVISELRKVTWPTAAETRYLTFVVAVVAIIVGTILGLFDLAFGWAIETVFFD
ncbi:MAG: preprotein translocase subunit SecE [Dehalococcoidia bacterium]|nr:preprotein translocase subunit SecE [Dehalococcoidia bacterium]MCA9845259.1 preprotein translocase subunit SecE [Dehalococcoidia bacterium]